MNWFAIGAVFGGIGVGLGAFGAHGLKSRLEPEMLAIFETGVRYQMYHALALLAVGYAAARWPGPLTQLSGWLFTLGILVFSGTLYALSISGLKWLGAITPLGGLCFILGWACLAWSAARGGG